MDYQLILSELQGNPVALELVGEITKAILSARAKKLLSSEKIIPKKDLEELGKNFSRFRQLIIDEIKGIDKNEVKSITRKTIFNEIIYPIIMSVKQ